MMLGINKKTIWEVMAFFQWMVIISFSVVYFLIGHPPLIHASVFGVLVYLVIVMLMVITSVAFIVHALTNKYLSKEKRIEWAILMLIFGLLVYPVYWWKHIRNTVVSMRPKTIVSNYDALVALEGKLVTLAECGFELLKPFTAQEMIDEWGAEYYHETGFENALYGLGGTEGDEPWRDRCETLWCFDTEYIEGNNEYVSIAERMMRMTQGSLVLNNIDGNVDIENEIAWFSYTFKGKDYRVDCEFDGDWTDTKIFLEFVDLLKISDPSKLYVYYDLHGQDVMIGCVTKENLEKLNGLGIKFEPLTGKL